MIRNSDSDLPPGSLDYQVLFGRSPNPYTLLDRDLNFVAANEAYLQVTGSRAGELIGRNVFEVFPGNPDNPDDPNVRMLRESFQRVLTERVSDTLALIPYTIARRTDRGVVHEERFWSATHTPILNEDGSVNYILQHTVDVSELQKLKRALRSAEVARGIEAPREQLEEGMFRRAKAVQEANLLLADERRYLRSLFEQAPGFITILRGPDFTFELVNAAYYQLVGHRSVLGKSVREALPELQGQGFLELLERVYGAAEPYVGHGMNVRLQREPGGALEDVFVDFIYQPIIEEDGTVSGIFVQGSDVTERKQTQARLQELNASLEERVANRTVELETRNRELQEFAYVVTHDLQEPLRKIVTFIDILMEEHRTRLDDDGCMLLDRIQAGAGRMSVLIQDLLAYSKITRQHEEFATVDLEQVANEALRDLELRIEETGGRVEIGSLPTMEANAVLLRQLFVNLIGNGLKFHKPGVPPVVGVKGRIETTEGTPDMCRIDINDNGVGFPQEYVDRIFTPFQRLHARDEFEGTGIGLAVCRRIVEHHGGTITAQSSPDAGSVFTVRLSCGGRAR